MREEAYRMARDGVEQERQQALARLAGGLSDALVNFEAARSRYFAAVEREVVELALAIAARILHREAQMDPLLLRGAVRVALGRLAESTEVQLAVPAADQPLWEETLRLTGNLPLQPAVTADEHLHVGECRLVAEVGSVDLGVKAQLEEIERGFFDLLDRRDGVGSSRRISDAAIA
ncbi:FliH/SctL family protein [Silvibacterium sp.]|uniref:FliH/SctL family protein n=1 Tax=Silvibacterium sp. TaxID=1964179 RepID=UPI0039E492C7